MHLWGKISKKKNFLNKNFRAGALFRGRSRNRKHKIYSVRPNRNCSSRKHHIQWHGYTAQRHLWPACRISRESMGCKTSQTTFTLTLDPCLLWPWPSWTWPTIFDLDLDPLDIDLGPSSLILCWKMEFLHFWPWWPWPLNEVWWSLTCVQNFRSVCPMVFSLQSANRQTHRQTDATENITSSALYAVWQINGCQELFGIGVYFHAINLLWGFWDINGRSQVPAHLH